MWRLVRAHLAILIACAILSFQLFLPPVIGLANNGDFGKMLDVFGLRAPVEYENAYAETNYIRDRNHLQRPAFWSSELLLLAPSVLLSALFSKTGVFDLRWIGLMHTALFLLALRLAEPLLAAMPRPRRILLWSMILLIFCDVLYAAYLNSFYMDVATYLFLLLSLVLYVRVETWHRRSDAIWLTVCAVLMILSKAQHILLGAGASFLLALRDRTLTAAAGQWFVRFPATVAVAATVFIPFAAPHGYSARSYYSVIFYGILPHARNPDQALRQLGFDDSYRHYIGTHAYSPRSPLDNPAVAEDFMQRTSYARVAWYFLRHPAEARLALEQSLAEAGSIRPYLGNFDHREGRPQFAQSQTFAFWSRMKAALFLDHGRRYLFCAIALALAVCGLATWLRARLASGMLAGCYVLAGVSVAEMLVASLGDAVDIPRHHFIFSATMDLLVLICAILLDVAVRHLRGRATTA